MSDIQIPPAKHIDESFSSNEDDEVLMIDGDCFAPRFIQTKHGSPFIVLMSCFMHKKKGAVGPACWMDPCPVICVGQLSKFKPECDGDIPTNWSKLLVKPSDDQLAFLKCHKVFYIKPST